MEPVELSIYDRAELDQIMVALLQRRNRLSVECRDKAAKEEAAVIDELLGRLNWDAAAAELEVA